MEFLKQLLEAALNKKYKIWFKDGNFTVRYAETEDAALAKVDPKQPIDRIEELS